jgi:processive 1,2-diacylglycerol beta-glucosyltransferase
MKIDNHPASITPRYGASFDAPRIAEGTNQPAVREDSVSISADKSAQHQVSADITNTAPVETPQESGSSKPAGSSPAPQEFIDLMKQIPPWKTVKVFLVHGSHTGGHRSAAESLKQALDEIPNVKSEVINALDFSGGETVKNTQVAATDFLIKKAGGVRGWFFKKSFEGNPVIYWLGKTGMQLKAWMSQSFLNKIQDEKPDIIVSTHSPMNAMLSYWKGRGDIDMPVHSVVTDFKAHRMWAQDNIDRYYVASEGVKQDLEKYGIEEEKIDITGIPIKPDFARPTGLTKTQLKEKLGLNPDLPMVLMMGGSLGIGRFAEVAKALDNGGMPVQMVCITGKNETKKQELEDLSAQLKMPLKAIGFTPNVNEWMEACDMIISKPGGLTTSEIFAKKIPMIILDPMPGLEEMLIPNIEATGAAFRVKGPGEAAALISDLMNDPEKKEDVILNLETAGKPFSAYTAAEDIVKSGLGTGAKTEA